jgi:hypothetical protein
MRLFPLVGFALLNPTILAQSATPTSAVVLQSQPLGANCPVGFSVNHAKTGGMLQTNSDRPHQVQPGPVHAQRRYDVTFSTLQTPRSISQAKVTLSGTSGDHLMPAGAGYGGDLTEDYTLTPTADGRHLFKSVLFADRITALSWVQLDEITYADGSKWHGTPEAPCRVAPSGFMLVASGK